MISVRAKVEAMWFEPYSSADVAFAINETISPIRHLSPARVRRIWRDAQRDGRLPPIERAAKGWSEKQLTAIRLLNPNRKEERAA